MEALTNWFTYVKDNFEFILEDTLDHAQMVLIVIALATVWSVLLGVLIHSRPIARSIVLSITGLFLTIPSLALFALFIPLVGVGNPPAMLAMFLDAVSPAVVESAKGMGLNSRQQLFKVRLPLAYPIVMTGIRVSTLLTTGIAAIAILVGGDGLGSFLQAGLTRLGLPNSENSVWVGVVFTVLLGLVLDLVLATFQRLTTARGLRI